MNFGWPRPPKPTEFNQYSLEHLRWLDVRPGVTGLWQVAGRHDPSFESYMALDLKYIESWSLWLDFKILLHTIPAVLRAEGH
jgi:lipopolysaccharide/colanic/teichoic acid biosynthesis glycosyltransferase